MAASKLLVSVRSASEAQAALDGGAAIIDVKEPFHGSLGRADRATVASVIAFIRNRVPVSAALGELADSSQFSPIPNLHYVKWGLAQSGARWQKRLLEAASRWTSINSDCRPVAVAYADWQQAQSPPPNEVWTFVRDNKWKTLLLDTFRKGEGTLLDWMSQEDIKWICRQCKDHKIEVALAGSLGRNEISTLLPFEPDIFAVRGAVCKGNDRTATVESDLVRGLASLLKGLASPLSRGAGPAWGNHRGES